jgi:hypothetical protein
MDAQRLRRIAQRCRELLGGARRPEVREQLQEWAKEAEAEAAGKELPARDARVS